MGRKATPKPEPTASVLSKQEVAHLASAFRWLGFDQHPTTMDHARSMGGVSAQRFLSHPPAPATVETVMGSACAHVSALARINGLGVNIVAAYVHAFRSRLPEELQEHDVPRRLVVAMKPRTEPRNKRESGQAA